MESLTIFFQNMFLYLYNQSGYMFYLLDILYQKINIEDEEDLIKKDNIYDIENDIIKLQYLVENFNYIFCFDRKDDINIKEIYEELIQVKEYQGYLMYAELNNKDITERLNKYLGSEGCHLNYNNFRIKWFLDNYEMENFNKLSIIDSMGNEKEYKNINDFLLN